MSRNFDLEYDDYKMRRGDGKRAENQKPGNFKPVDEDEEGQKERNKSEGDYGIPSNDYQMQGITERPTNMGSDSLASIRTLRNHLRVMSLEHKDRDEPVKSHLCKSACDQLSQTEKQLIDLSSQRSDALVRGNTAKAENIAKQMETVKSDAIKTTYSDLMIDDKTMKAFGVDSKWTPDKNPMPPDNWRPITPMKVKSRAATPARERTPSRQSNRSRPASQKSIRKQPTEDERPKSIRKNKRLSETVQPPPEDPFTDNQEIQDDPYQAPTFIGRCPHCQLTENGLARPGGLEQHYAKYCKVMTCCKYCLKMTLVSQLTEHLIYRCDFLKGTMENCRNCGLSVSKDDQASGAGHPMCRGRQPPAGAQWCPLCTIAVDDDEENWRQHLANKCYNNPRRNGPEKDPWEIKKEQDQILKDIEEREQRARDLAEQQKRQDQERADAQAQTSKQGRMIDADKLVTALKEIQDRKKKSKTPVKDPETEQQ